MRCLATTSREAKRSMLFIVSYPGFTMGALHNGNSTNQWVLNELNVGSKSRTNTDGTADCCCMHSLLPFLSRHLQLDPRLGKARVHRNPPPLPSHYATLPGRAHLSLREGQVCPLSFLTALPVVLAVSSFHDHVYSSHCFAEHQTTPRPAIQHLNAWSPTLV